MKTITRLILLSALAVFASCKDDEGMGGGSASSGSSTEGFFFKQAFNYNLTSDPVVEVPVVRLGTEGDLTVEVAASGASEFTVPSEVVIKSGDRMGTLAVTYDPSKLSFNQVYEIALSIKDYTSIYGYQNATVTIEKPTSYYKYGAGTIVEDWWGEQEDKEMFVREYAENVLQCYLPQCWGHDSGGPDKYPVQDYVFFWNTKTNKVYVPFQFMGCEDWCIADQGAIACKFGGPGYKEGSAEWRSYIDTYYTTCAYPQPHYDPEKKAFYLSDSAACSPADGSVAYGTPGRPDVFTLE